MASPIAGRNLVWSIIFEPIWDYKFLPAGTNEMWHLGLRIVSLIMAVMLSAPTLASVDKRRIALLIGNQSYKTAVGPLKNPLNDIALVGESLGKIGFKVSVSRNAGRKEILRAIRQYSDSLREAGNGAIGFFYYSGHGAADFENGKNYLIPTDVERADSEDVWDDSVSLEWIIDRLRRRAPNATQFVVFDACRNELKSSTKTLSKGFQPQASADGMLIAFSTAPNRPAYDVGVGAGPYARALSEELARPGTHHLDLFQNVKERVDRVTDGRQLPWERNGLRRRVFLVPESSSKRRKTEPRLANSAPATGGQALAVDKAWRFTQSVATCEAYAAFESEFKGTFRARLASAWRRKHCATDAKPADEATNNKVASASKEQTRRLARKVQVELKRLGCYPGEIDGVWGGGSREAAKAFARRKGIALANLEPTNELLGHTRRYNQKVCPLVCAPGSIAKNGNCIPRLCPDGSKRNSDGDCQTTTAADSRGCTANPVGKAPEHCCKLVRLQIAEYQKAMRATSDKQYHSIMRAGIDANRQWHSRFCG